MFIVYQIIYFFIIFLEYFLMFDQIFDFKLKIEFLIKWCFFIKLGIDNPIFQQFRSEATIKTKTKEFAKISKMCKNVQQLVKNVQNREIPNKIIKTRSGRGPVPVRALFATFLSISPPPCFPCFGHYIHPCRMRCALPDAPSARQRHSFLFNLFRIERFCNTFAHICIFFNILTHLCTF